MQRGRGGRSSFFDFGDPFTGFGGFGGVGGRGSLISSFFGGRDPFDDPFFTRPFGGMFDSSFVGPSGNPFVQTPPSGMLEDQPPQSKRTRGPIIEEINSDDEKQDADKEKKSNSRKHGRSGNEPYVEDPDDEERNSKHLQNRSDYSRFSDLHFQPQTRHFTFQSSSVTYGGSNGAYYTASKTRRTGSDGLTIEESKEADTAARQATHSLSRGLHNKGHSVTRKLNSDGRVDSMQTLHNLNEDELSGFEEAWKGKAQKHLPGWTGSIGASSSRHDREAGGGGGWALPSTEFSQDYGRIEPDTKERVGSSHSQNSGRVMVDIRDKRGSRGRARD